MPITASGNHSIHLSSYKLHKDFLPRGVASGRLVFSFEKSIQIYLRDNV